MGWQEIIALGIVALTVAAFAWKRLRRRRFDFKRDTHCGCSAPRGNDAQQSIVYHARKGERPRVIVKMK